MWPKNDDEEEKEKELALTLLLMSLLGPKLIFLNEIEENSELAAYNSFDNNRKNRKILKMN
jgi:hypothetical protein